MDIYGRALLDYLEGNYTEDMLSETSISEYDTFPIPYLFRSYEEMPIMEQKALDLSFGKTLDIGSGSGSHALYLQEKGIEVTAIDTSPGACEVARRRGIKKVLNQDVKNLSSQDKFDTLLLMMNGAGMAGTLENSLGFYLKLKELLTENGQILVDSTDIIYMFQDEDGGVWRDLNQEYYGEVEFKIAYKGQESESFDWVYIDFENLEKIAQQAGLKAEKVVDGPHYNYLARLTIAPTNS